MNRYDRYPGDYMRDTIDLSMVEDGAYTRLLDVYYANERPIDDAAKFRISRAMDDAEREATQRVLDRFFRPITDGSKKAWIHDRVEREIEKARPRIEAAKRNGRLGGRPPKQLYKPNGFSDGSALGNPNGNQEPNRAKNPGETQVESSPSPPPSPSVTDPSPTPSKKPKRRKVKPSAPPDPNHTPTVTLYVECFQKARGVKPSMDGKAAKDVQRLLKRVGPERAAEAIRGAYSSPIFAGHATIATIANDPDKYTSGLPGRPRTPQVQPPNPTYDVNKYNAN